MIIDKFDGLRNDVNTERFDPADLSTALNVTIDDSRNIARRSGATLQISATDAHSLWCHGNDICLFVEGTDLKRVELDWSISTLRSGLSRLPMSYTHYAGRTYYCNGSENGVIYQGVDHIWGFDVPDIFAASETSGNLLPGQYTYSLMYVSADGVESGSLPGSVIDITDGGIAFSQIPVSDNPDVDYKIILLTTANGTTLFESLLLDNAATTATIIDSEFEIAAETVNQCGPPMGHLVAEYMGHILVAADDVLYRSQAYGPELFDLRDYMMMNGRITMIAPADNGIFIGTTKEIGYISGNGFDEATYTIVADYGAIEGSVTTVESNLVSSELTEGTVSFWLSDKGICQGLDGGQIQNITNKRYNVTASSRGASIVQEIGGSSVLISSL